MRNGDNGDGENFHGPSDMEGTSVIVMPPNYAACIIQRRGKKGEGGKGIIRLMHTPP